MVRLIDAEALMATIRQHDYRLATQNGSVDNGMFTLGIQQAVDEQPTVDAMEVVHGEWKFHEPDKHGNKKPYCTNCGRYPLTNWPDYIRCKVCPNCGAKMDLPLSLDNEDQK